MAGVATTLALSVIAEVGTAVDHGPLARMASWMIGSGGGDRGGAMAQAQIHRVSWPLLPDNPRDAMTVP